MASDFEQEDTDPDALPAGLCEDPLAVSLERVFGRHLATVQRNVPLLPERVRAHRAWLLEGLARLRPESPDEASAFFTALCTLLRPNPLRSSRGSYLGALVQLFLESALQDQNEAHRLFAFRSLHELLRAPGVARIEGLLRRFGYGEEHVSDAQEDVLMGPDTDPALLLEALAYAANAGYPGVVYARIHHALQVPMLPHKLAELSPAPPGDQGRSLRELLEWYPPARLAEVISGTHHTAFVDDLRVAFKVLSVLEAEHRWRVRERALAAERHAGLLAEVDSFLASGEELTPETLVRLVGFSAEDGYRRLTDDFLEGAFDVFVPCLDEFDRRMDETHVGFIQTRGGRPEIFIKNLLPAERTPEAVIERTRTLVHEWEHFRHCLRGYAPASPLTARVRLEHCDPQTTLVSEMLAFLEEARWSLSCGLIGEADTFDRQGGVVLAVRDHVESIYLS